jgi:2-polyprenyl-6-methoxyphenol hydroxylase-like FAD-dependent oxidoreductase
MLSEKTDNDQARDLHIGIVGAGIGGLAAAIAFRRAGTRVTVLEAAEELGEVRVLSRCRLLRY